MALHRCLRILPHVQDTGGFFVAVLRKTAEVPKAAAPTPHPFYVSAAASSSSSAAASSASSSAMDEVSSSSSSSSSSAADFDADIDRDVEPTPAHLDVTGDVPTVPSQKSAKSKQAAGNSKGKKDEDDENEGEDDVMRPVLVCDPKPREFCRRFFGITDELSDHNLFARSENQKRIYFLGDDVAAILRAREQVCIYFFWSYIQNFLTS
jgi:hypothetical protein